MRLLAAMAAGALLVAGAGAGAAHAQVSEDQYGQYFDFITSAETWICDTAMPLDWIDDGELNSVVELNFHKSYSGGYNFTGDGKETINYENHDYVETFTFEGFGVNDSSFGTGVSIRSVTKTSGDPGWTWHTNENIQLHLEQNADGKFSLVGYQNRDDGQITYECGS